MLTKRIIPCLDVKKGHVVKGIKFQNHKIMGDPVELAIKYSDQNADELVFYDIYSSVEDSSVPSSWIENIAKNWTEIKSILRKCSMALKLTKIAQEKEKSFFR